jgi:hypothetical protein
MILRTKRDGSTVRYEPKEAARLVHRLRNKLGLPAMFTPDACGAAAMMELEDGQGMRLE